MLGLGSRFGLTACVCARAPAHVCCGQGMADSFTRSILMKDLVALQKKPLPFAWIPEDVLIDDNILTWQMWLLGPEGTQLCVQRRSGRQAGRQTRAPQKRGAPSTSGSSLLARGLSLLRISSCHCVCAADACMPGRRCRAVRVGCTRFC